MDLNKKMPKIAMGAWSWGSGASGADQVFGNHFTESDLKPVFDAAMEAGRLLYTEWALLRICWAGS